MGSLEEITRVSKIVGKRDVNRSIHSGRNRQTGEKNSEAASPPLPPPCARKHDTVFWFNNVIEDPR